MGKTISRISLLFWSIEYIQICKIKKYLWKIVFHIKCWHALYIPPHDPNLKLSRSIYYFTTSLPCFKIDISSEKYLDKSHISFWQNMKAWTLNMNMLNNIYYWYSLDVLYVFFITLMRQNKWLNCLAGPLLGHFDPFLLKSSIDGWCLPLHSKYSS